MYASQCGNEESMRALLEKGALLETAVSKYSQDNGKTALMLASSNGHADTVRMLLEKGALLKTVDMSCRTALMWASTSGQADTVRMLLEKGKFALLEAVDKNGKTALRIAEEYGNGWHAHGTRTKGHDEVVVLIKEHMAHNTEVKNMFALGTNAAKNGDNGGAYDLFSQSLLIARTVELKSEILASRSAVLCSMLRWEEALVDADECILIRKSWSSSYACQATALYGLGRGEEADQAQRLSLALAQLKQDPQNEVCSAAQASFRSL